MKVVKNITLFLLIFTFNNCKKDIIEKPIGNAQAKEVWNCAYQENYDPDKIDDVIANATNAYVLIDPFEGDNYQRISEIKSKGNEVCAYISIGTGEDWRSDWNQLKPYCVSKQWSKWKGEYFIDVTTTGLIDVMKARIDKIANWGCDWVEFDNMDWAFDEESRKKYNIRASEQDAINYYNELCDYVHSKGMKCQAKNTVRNAPNFDALLCESFNNDKDWWNHAEAQSYLDAGKMVIVNHYKEKRPNATYQEYINLYNAGISFICESKKEKKYIHYNE